MRGRGSEQASAQIAACDGDPRATVRALIVANSFLTEQVDTLTKELDWLGIGSPRATRAAPISGV